MAATEDEANGATGAFRRDLFAGHRVLVIGGTSGIGYNLKGLHPLGTDLQRA